ncbi:MAG: hypothetical protein QNJ92_02585 [Alphaproteobacteria bacterium]|nr:hypothetical protein [Alphaproteobacteria bacterium]
MDSPVTGEVDYGPLEMERIDGLSGLQIFQAMLAGEIPMPTICRAFDFRLVEVAHGKAVFQGTPDGRFGNPLEPFPTTQGHLTGADLPAEEASGAR